MADDHEFEADLCDGDPGEPNGAQGVPAGERLQAALTQGSAGNGPLQAGVNDANVTQPAASTSERESSGLVNGDDDAAPSDSFSRFISGTPSTADEADDGAEGSILPRQPRTLLDLGLSKAFLTDLVLKIIHYS